MTDQPTKRQEILEQAIKEVTQVKTDEYGKPEDSFTVIAAFWDVYDKYRKPGPVTAKDVAMKQILLKVAREMFKHKMDNLVDISGYAACAGEIAVKDIPF